MVVSFIILNFFADVFKFDFEEQDLSEAAVRALVWKEMHYYSNSSSESAQKA